MSVDIRQVVAKIKDESIRTALEKLAKESQTAEDVVSVVSGTEWGFREIGGGVDTGREPPPAAPGGSMNVRIFPVGGGGIVPPAPWRRPRPRRPDEE